MRTIINEVHDKIKTLTARNLNLQRSSNRHIQLASEDLKNMEENTKRIETLQREVTQLEENVDSSNGCTAGPIALGLHHGCKSPGRY